YHPEPDASSRARTPRCIHLHGFWPSDLVPGSRTSGFDSHQMADEDLRSGRCHFIRYTRRKHYNRRPRCTDCLFRGLHHRHMPLPLPNQQIAHMPLKLGHTKMKTLYLDLVRSKHLDYGSICVHSGRVCYRRQQTADGKRSLHLCFRRGLHVYGRCHVQPLPPWENHPDGP
ncbi:Protein RTM1, partial [Colletotrichum gloeosporioides]